MERATSQEVAHLLSFFTSLKRGKNAFSYCVPSAMGTKAKNKKMASSSEQPRSPLLSILNGSFFTF